MRKLHVVLLVGGVIQERAIDALSVSPVTHIKSSTRVKNLAFSVVFGSKPNDEPDLNNMPLSTAMENIDLEISGDDEGATSTSTKTAKKGGKGQVKHRTKAQIKSLKFFMAQDVEELIEKNDPSAPAKAQENIDRLNELYELHQNPDYKPTSHTYNTLVRAYAKSGREDAAMMAEKVVNEMLDLHKSSGDDDIQPTAITYTELIDAHAKSKKKDAAEKAEQILFDLMNEASTREDDGSGLQTTAPTSITCDVVINAWARRGTREGAERATYILERMEYFRTMGNLEIQPTPFSFATVISAWAKSGAEGAEIGEKAEYILQQMLDFRKKILSQKGSEEYAMQLLDSVVFNSVIDAWARSKDPQAGTRAEALLNKMEEMYNLSGKTSSSICPDSITYNSVINCHANSGHIHSAKAAEKVLKRMEIASSSDDENRAKVIPNTRTYNQVLKAYASSQLPGAAQRADLLLRYMLQSQNNENIRPDVISFSTCLDVWAKSKEPGKARKAQAILHKMIEFSQRTGIEAISPNEVTYNTVLNACAFSAFTSGEEKKEAISIAVSTLNEMQQSDVVKPDAITYGMLLKCIANLVPFGAPRNKMASSLFQKCCEAGLVNSLVFNEIRRAVSSDVMAGILGCAELPKAKRKRYIQSLDVSNLPRQWRCNVKESKQHRSINKKIRPLKKEVSKQRKMKKGDNLDQAPRPIRPMRSITETSWQSGRDV